MQTQFPLQKECELGSHSRMRNLKNRGRKKEGRYKNIRFYKIRIIECELTRMWTVFFFFLNFTIYTLIVKFYYLCIHIFRCNGVILKGQEMCN
jgi:hypothetical protein